MSKPVRFSFVCGIVSSEVEEWVIQGGRKEGESVVSLRMSVKKWLEAASAIG